MDYPTWPYFYDSATRFVWLNWQMMGDENPVSGDDTARIKAGHRA